MALNRLWSDKITQLGENKQNLTLKIILDSNFLFLPAQFHIDIFEEVRKLLNKNFEPVLLSSTYEEIKKFAKSKNPRIVRQATIALLFAQKCKITPIQLQPEESNDDAILRLATKWKCPVATNDRLLRKRLRKVNIPVIFLRQKSHLEIEGNID
jgi:rRNA-processing protein FCF1